MGSCENAFNLIALDYQLNIVKLASQNHIGRIFKQ